MSIADLQSLAKRLREESEKVLVGMDEPFELLTIALLTGGHVLLEGVPGTAKTLMAKTLANLIQADFGRIQFTPDLMPSDILGTSIFDINTGEFRIKQGPIFTQILLADEVNRAPAKTQSALLETMEEHQVTLEGERFLLPPPFMVIATQNPIEYEGTYPLPEAQLDRFLFKIVVPYAALETDIEVLRRYNHGFDARNLAAAQLQPVLGPAEIAQVQATIRSIIVEDGVLRYIAEVAAASRRSPDLTLGASTRAITHVLLAAKTFAGLQGREYVTPDDVKFVTPPVYRHRILLKPEAEIEGLDPDGVIKRLLNQVDVPR